MKIRGAAQLIANFKRRGFLALDADRVDAVDDFHFAGFAELADDAQRIVKVSLPPQS